MKPSHFNVAKFFSARRFLKAVSLRGNSMAPTYNEGDWLLFRLIRAAPTKSNSLNKLIGKVVLIRRESKAGSDFFQVKRVMRIEAGEIHKAKFWVEGDNKDASTDSRSWGALSEAEVVGQLLFRYRRARNN